MIDRDASDSWEAFGFVAAFHLFGSKRSRAFVSGQVGLLYQYVAKGLETSHLCVLPMTLNTFPARRQECDLQDVSHIGKLFALFACPLGLFPEPL